MYPYPLTLSFSAFSVTPKIDIRDSSGLVVMTASKKLLSSKDEIDLVSGNQPLAKIMSQENRITDIPSNWDISDPDGILLGVVDDDYMTALDGVKFGNNQPLNDFLQMQTHRALGLRSVKMYWLKNKSGKQIGFIAPDQRSLAIEQLPLYQITRKLPFANRFITPNYAIQLEGKLVMKLRKLRTFLVDKYVLETSDTFSDQDEKFLLPSVVLTVVYERQRLKDLYE